MDQEAASESFSTPARKGWFAQLLQWIRTKRLEREFRTSEKFQKKCEQFGCVQLAELEERYREELAERIKSLKQ